MIDAYTYPRPRHRQAEPSMPQPEGPQLPRMRYFSGTFTPADNLRFTFTGPRLTGPAIFKHVNFYSAAHGAGSQVQIELGWTLEPTNENGVARTTPRRFTPLTEVLTANFTQPNPGSKGIFDDTIPNTFVRWAEPLDLLVDIPFFYPVISFSQNVAGVMPYFWGFRVAEQVNRRNLQLFPSAGQGPARSKSATTPAYAGSTLLPASVHNCRCSTRHRPTPSLTRGTGRTTATRTTSSKAQRVCMARAGITSLTTTPRRSTCTVYAKAPHRT